MLGGGVGMRAQAALQAGGTGHTQDRALAAGRHHPCRVFEDVESAVEQYVDTETPLFTWRCFQGADGTDNAGAVKYHIQLAEVFHRLVNGAGHLVFRGHVAGQVNTFPG